MTVLVTGATGSIGPRLAHTFRKAGHTVRTFSLDRPALGAFPPNVDERLGDVTDQVAAQSAMQGVDAVVHMAALLHIINPPPEMRETYERVNVGGTAMVVEAAIRAGVKRVVLFSTIAVYGHSDGRILNEMSPTHPDIGMVCPRVLNEDGTNQFLNKRYLNVMDLFVRRFLPPIFHPILKHRLDRYQMRDVGYDKICDVECIPGAFMLCRKAVLKAVGGFDPRYFMYFEDGDLCRKFRLYGYRTVCYPNATVIHGYERASHKSVKMAMILIANMFRYFNKWGWKWL